MPATFEQIYSTIVEYCPPATQRPGLQRLLVAEGARSGTSDPDGLLRRLREQFSPEQLREVGVLAPAGNGATGERLHEDLATENKPFLVLCDETNRPIDLLTAHGSLRYRYAAVLSVAQDRNFRKCLTETGTMFIVFSIEDMIKLRSLGLAATLATGLDRLRGPSLDQFMQLLPPAVEKFALNPVRAMTAFLVGWSFTQPKGAPPGFEAAVGHLQKLQRHLQVPLEPVQIWRLKDDEIERLNFVLRNERPNAIATRVVEIAKAGSRPLVEAPKLTLSAAYEALHKAVRERYSEICIRAARQQLEALIQEGFVGPLFDEAEAAPDALVRSLKLNLAHLVRELHHSQVDRSLNQQRIRAPAARESDREDLEEISSLTNAILKISKQINPCTKLTANGAFPFHLPRSRLS